MASVAALVVLACVSHSAGLGAPVPVPVPRTFGNAVISYIRNETFEPLVVLEHNLSAGSAYGVMTHYWSTGEVVNWDTVVDYFVDGELTPSISLMEDMYVQRLRSVHGHVNVHSQSP